MSGKEISLTGEPNLRSTGFHITVGALEALKVIGIAYGLYDHAEEFSGLSVSLQEEGRPVLVVQQDIGQLENSRWETIRTVTEDPEQIRRYMAFREMLKMFRQMDRDLERNPKAERHQGYRPAASVQRKRNSYER